METKTMNLFVYFKPAKKEIIYSVKCFVGIKTKKKKKKRKLSVISCCVFFCVQILDPPLS